MPLRLLPLVVGPAILLPLAVYAFRHRRVRGAAWYCTLLLAIALWSAAYAWELAVVDPAQKLLALRIKYLGVVAMPVAWIGFVLDFVARERVVVRRVARRMAVVGGHHAADRLDQRVARAVLGPDDAPPRGHAVHLHRSRTGILPERRLHLLRAVRRAGRSWSSRRSSRRICIASAR